jgi:hypothetical protein
MAKTKLSPALQEYAKGKSEEHVQAMVDWQNNMPCKNNPHSELKMVKGCWCRSPNCNDNCMLFKEWANQKPKVEIDKEVSDAEDQGAAG